MRRSPIETASASDPGRSAQRRRADGGAPARHDERRLPAPDRAPEPAPDRESPEAFLTRAVGGSAFKRFFETVTEARVSDGSLIVSSASAFHSNLLDRRFGRQLRESWAGEVEFVTRAAADAPIVDAPADPPPGPSAPRARRTARAWSLLEDFVAGDSNRLALDAARRVAESSGRCPFSPLFLFGMCGTGKTHLLEGVAAHFRARPGTPRVRVVSAEQFMSQFVASIQNRTAEQFRARFRSLDLLCVDDAHDLARRSSTQTELLHTLDALALAGSRVVLASDTHPTNLKDTADALRSRFLSGLVVEIGAPEPELLAAIAGQRALARGLTLDTSALAAVRAIAEDARCAGDPWSARNIEGLILRVDALRGANGRPAGAPVTGVEIAQAGAMFRTASRGTASPPSWDALSTLVCRRVGVERSSLSSRGRHASVVLARGLCALLARRVTPMSYPEIARAMGRPNHSTIVTACNRMEQRIADAEQARTAQGDESIPALVQELEQTLGRAGAP